MGRPIDENYSRNQCALMIRVDGDEIYMPLNFGIRADEIREIYPYLLDMFNSQAPNPSIQFQKDDKDGKYEGLSEKDRRNLLIAVKKMSMLWYNKAEESLLTIAMRFAVDIKLRGIDELRHLFETVRPLHLIDGDPLSDDEVEQVLERTGMTHPTDKEFDPGDENDIPLGIAGDMGVNLYESGAPEDYMSDDLDRMESKLAVQDTFKAVADGTAGAHVDVASKYEKGRKLTEAQMKGGLLGMYGDSDSDGSVFDELDKKDGLSDAKFDDDYEDHRREVESSDPGDDGFVEGLGGGLDEGEPFDDEPFDDEGSSGDEIPFDYEGEGDEPFDDLYPDDDGDGSGDDGSGDGELSFGDYDGELPE